MANTGSRTLADLRLNAQQLSDMVNSTFVSTQEWNTFLNTGYMQLYNLLVEKFGANYFMAQALATSDGVNDQISLPPDFFKLCGVDLQVGAKSWTTLKSFTFSERNGSSESASLRSTNLRYRIHGDNLWLIPVPTAGQVFRIWYVPRVTALVNDSDTVDGVSGWEQYIILSAAIAAMVKEESDPSVLMAQLGAMVKQIEDAAENRDVGAPAKVTDVYSDGLVEFDGSFRGYR